MLIQRLTLRNLLSYGPEAPELPLARLNVIIGPNGSGKSNLIEAIGLLQAAPKDLTAPIREGGGVHDWIWKGGENPPLASIEMIVEYLRGPGPLRYHLAFTETGQRFRLSDERIENERPDKDHSDPYFYFRYEYNRPVINLKCIAPGSLDTSLSHAAGLSDIAVCHA